MECFFFISKVAPHAHLSLLDLNNYHMGHKQFIWQYNQQSFLQNGRYR